MKTLLLKVFYLLLLSNLAIGQSHNQPYDFPVRPGTTEWKHLKTSQEMIDACQIPDDIIKDMSTNDLVNLCITYPLLGDMLFASNLQVGFDHLSKIFNGLQELTQREDAGIEMLKAYTAFSLDDFNNGIMSGVTNPFLDMCLDILMAQPVFLESLNKDQQVELLRVSLIRLDERKALGDSFYRQKTTAAILYRLLALNSTNFNMTSPVEDDSYSPLGDYFILVNSDAIDSIRVKARGYLDKLK
jgi:hypothetical protein